MSADDDWIVPPPLEPGSRLRVIAPSSPFDRALVLRGLGWLAERYRVEFDPGLFSREGYLAGSDARRLDELTRALTDPGVAGVLAARGGYGLTRIAHRTPVEELRAAPRWLVGFSDVTALHVEASRCRVASWHAPNVAGLGRSDPALRAAWIHALEAPSPPLQIDALSVWRGGRAVGRLFGGNLTVLFTCAAAGRLTIPDGAVLLLEDVSEQTYRLDRMLTALQVGGHLDRVSACAVGDFTDCAAGPYGVEATAVLAERLLQLGVPVLAGVPAGHGNRNLPLPLGTRVIVDGDRGCLCAAPA